MLVNSYFANFPEKLDLKQKYEYLRWKAKQPPGPNMLYIDDPTSMETYLNKYKYVAGLGKLATFINKNISINMDIIYNTTTLEVYCRIITGMINKLENEGIITKDQNILLHDSIIESINKAKLECKYYFSSKLFYDVPF